MDVGYPEDRDRAEERLDETAAGEDDKETGEPEDADEVVVDG